MTLDNLKRALTKRFRKGRMEGADIEAQWLIEHVLGYSASDIIVRGDEAVPRLQFDRITALAERRLDHEPLDHILGYREFYGRRFDISKDVLSPRPETEGLVTEALRVLKPVDRPDILDLGTGSGAIIITLLAERADAHGLAVDLSLKALDVAKVNAQRHDVSGRLGFENGSWFDPVSGVFDLIVSNPPYISDEAMTRLEPEVQNFDPALALSGGRDGLDPYGLIIQGAPGFLRPGGWLMFEIGFDQGEAVAGMMRARGFESVRILQDLAEHDRIVTGMKSEK